MPKEYFVHVSRLDPDKDLNTLLEAFQLFVSKTGSSTALVIIGDGKFAKRWQIQASKLPCSQQIIFKGFKTNPYPYMKHAKALILSSKCEGLPTVLLEALACCDSRIVVSSDCPDGPREILQDGLCGLLYPPENCKALANMMEEIDLGKIAPGQFSDSADKTLQRFDLTTIVNQIKQEFSFFTTK